ncbi:MAG: GNAT family N-acetyltransferase [Pseudomonadota bacterium]|nr:GNAT family N-acetyltransferase [Pseudomonadota bacterium]
MTPVDTAALHSSAIRIEEAGLNALQMQRQLFYDGWLIRLSPGPTKRARSVSAQWSSTLPLDVKLDHCEAVYARHHLPPLFRLTPFAHPAGLEQALIERGYISFDETLVQAVELLYAPEPPPPPEESTLHVVDVARFVDVAASLRGSSAEQRAAHLERLRGSPLEARYVEVEAAGQAVAAAQMSCEGGLAGIFDVMTASEMRGRGYASAAVGKLMTWAWEHAMRTVYLQVTASNRPALAIYGKWGFSTRYTYHYRGRAEDIGR